MNVAVLAGIDLALLVVAASFGLASLLRWLHHRSAEFPTAKAVTHVLLQFSGIAVWAVFALTAHLALAWIAFALLTAGQVFGDLLMFASYRARHPGSPPKHYLAVGGDVLSFRRPTAGLHAAFGALAWFGMLGICIAASITR